MDNHYLSPSLDDNYIPKMTVALIVINVAAWLVLELLGDTESAVFMMQHGAMTVQYVQDGKWYVLLTAMFLHFGYMHLIQNMFVLFFASRYLEQETGAVYYLFIYMVSGLTGNLCSYFVSSARTETISVSAGASGAVFGVLGALVALALLKHGKLAGVSRQGVIVMALLCVLQGFTTVGVNNTAHIAGMASGALMGLLYHVLHKQSGITG